MSEIDHLLREFEEQLSYYTADERKEIMAAARWAEGLHHNQKRASGEPYFIHPMEVARILVNLRLDYKAVVAAFLHDVLEDTDISRWEMRKEFGKEVESLVNGVTKISGLHTKSKTIQEAETIRKMLFAMVKDIRVILIKLADKLHNMRTLGYLNSERQKRIATECLDIYSPLAGRLGISWLKDELEDLALKNLRPEEYEQIKKFVSHKRGERAEYLQRVKKAILQAASKEKIRIEVKTRAKHFYSIFQKHKKKGKPLEEIFDLLGIRILCRTPVECYALLGLVHTLWRPKAGRFKDYIAMPKSNRYQSLHTTVMCYEGKLLEIQIRTYEMHQTAENGVAAHWLYKSGLTNETVSVQDLPIINKLKSWNRNNLSSSEFLEDIKHELLKDLIYVFTPKGDVIELPSGATAVDFAYHIHTEVGNHCIGAKVDGNIVPLRRPLKNGEVVEVLTASNARPHINWLHYAKTSRTRSKVRHWLNVHDTELFLDQKIIARRKVVEKAPGKPKRRKDSIEKRIFDPGKVGVRVEKQRNVLLRFAQCCNPQVGDDIIGYISRTRGLIVHRADCTNLEYIQGINDRMVEVEWEIATPKTIRQLRIAARSNSDLFSIIEAAIRRYNGNLLSGNLLEDHPDQLVGIFRVELANKEDLKKIVKYIRSLDMILNVHVAAR